MKPVKNDTPDEHFTLTYDHGILSHCYLCGRPSNGTVYMCPSCWANSTAEDRRQACKALHYLCLHKEEIIVVLKKVNR